jgi:hypothetical protein
MKPGIYYVTFSNPSIQNVGEGLAVFKDSKVNGGDIGYFYRGSYSIKDSTITARLQIRRWNPVVTSVFGSYPEFELEVKGSMTADSELFSAEGTMTEQPQLTITIKGRRLGDAA